VSTLGDRELSAISPALVRHWHARLSASERPGAVTVAKCYRLLRTILGTAVDDELIVKNPCVLKGAGVERSPERPVATIAQVELIADAVEPRYRMLVLLATFTGLRFGELAALTRRRVDLDAGTVAVVVAQSELSDGTRIIGEPKSVAGRRLVAIPSVLIDDFRQHLDDYAEADDDGLVFVGPKGGPLRRGNWSVQWNEVVAELGLEDLHFHDLRHTGNTLAAATGASTRELMTRMGHSSSRAALIYQHASQDREMAIGRALSQMIETARGAGPPKERAR
jgi:integrase